MINFNVDPKFKNPKTEEVLKRAAEIALAAAGSQRLYELTIVLTSDAKIQKLNRQFRGESQPTDVLSFPADELDLETGEHYLGDVVISVPRAKEQAEKDGHPLEAELQLLTVHGVLHLLGHDHGSEAEREKMWAQQDEILTKLGSYLRSVHVEARSH